MFNNVVLDTRDVGVETRPSLSFLSQTQARVLSGPPVWPAVCFVTNPWCDDVDHQLLLLSNFNNFAFTIFLVYPNNYFSIKPQWKYMVHANPLHRSMLVHSFELTSPVADLLEFEVTQTEEMKYRCTELLVFFLGAHNLINVKISLESSAQSADIVNGPHKTRAVFLAALARGSTATKLALSYGAARRKPGYAALSLQAILYYAVQGDPHLDNTMAILCEHGVITYSDRREVMSTLRRLERVPNMDMERHPLPQRLNQLASMLNTPLRLSTLAQRLVGELLGPMPMRRINIQYVPLAPRLKRDLLWADNFFMSHSEHFNISHNCVWGHPVHGVPNFMFTPGFDARNPQCARSYVHSIPP